jgi:hypothetical protein
MQQKRSEQNQFADRIRSSLGSSRAFGHRIARFLSENTSVVCVKFSKREIGVRVGKRAKAYSQTPEARLRQPEPRRERARALTPSQSNRFVKKPSHPLRRPPRAEVVCVVRTAFPCSDNGGLRSSPRGFRPQEPGLGAGRSAHRGRCG